MNFQVESVDLAQRALCRREFLLHHRLLTAAVLIIFVLAVLFYLPQHLFYITVIIICGLAISEWLQFVKIHNVKKRTIIASSVTLILVVLYLCLPAATIHKLLLTLICIAPMWWIFAALLVFTYPKSSPIWNKSNILIGLFGCLSILPFGASVIVLRYLNYDINPYHGTYLLLFIFSLVWSADSGAYAVGRLCGKNKLLPKVSPNKTIEGALGGLVAAMCVASIIGWWGVLPYSLFTLLKLALLVVFVAMLGDLVESMFKREENIKDSGTLVPGHGGVLDRIDSLLSAVPIFAYFTLYHL